MARKVERRAAPNLLADGDLSRAPALVDEVEVVDAIVTGDYFQAELSLIDVAASRFDDAQLTGARILRSRLVDCMVINSDLSGVVLDQCQLQRVEFHGCRLSGLQAFDTRLHDIAFVGCKLDGANFRLTTWERAEFDDCEMIDVDFYGAKLPHTSFRHCNLSGANLSKATLTGSRLHGSLIEGVTGGDALRGVSIATDQVIPVALALFDAYDIVVTDS